MLFFYTTQLPYFFYVSHPYQETEAPFSFRFKSFEAKHLKKPFRSAIPPMGQAPRFLRSFLLMLACFTLLRAEKAWWEAAPGVCLLQVDVYPYFFEAEGFALPPSHGGWRPSFPESGNCPTTTKFSPLEYIKAGYSPFCSIFSSF